MSKRAEYIYALYEGSLAEPGDRNPYAGDSLILAKLWLRGYQRMLSVRIDTGPAMQRYRAAQAEETQRPD
ncbi:hypothetical protein FHR72_004341 [Mycolicibacterium iranicum]|uniref:Uncharacterized protein n=1 Tax=Mycolicibacterium iranicum TaxID=912594 RepID=A0A839QFD0_MYCIR|nr:hypothetical protein [Mycolicibacterium iranicum]MBB2992836.1 hypothetical protein [Mycolicibacterium iranicum]